MEENRIKLAEVSEGLRKALEEGEWPDGKARVAVGIAPDGMNYLARVWHDDLVFIDLADDYVFTDNVFMEVKPSSRERISLPEPEGVVWEPLLPSPVIPPRRRRWWQF